MMHVVRPIWAGRCMYELIMKEGFFVMTYERRSCTSGIGARPESEVTFHINNLYQANTLSSKKGCDYSCLKFGNR